MRSVFALLLAFGSISAGAAVPSLSTFFQSYVIVGDGGKAIARVVTGQEKCPQIAVDGRPPFDMGLRIGAARVRNRGSAQADSKDADFPVSVCETPLPAGTRSVVVNGVRLPVPVAQPQRILFVGDTGCRMKASEAAFQACNDRESWPFETISRHASAWRPDLVVHLGDIHYRESPCPASQAGCAGSPWGYGFDAWDADFFRPARALLEIAPWVVVRGNHESCARAGQGWFRFMDRAPYASGRSCDNPALDGESDFSAPYVVPIAGNTQLIVFDSSQAAGKASSVESAVHQRYAAQFQQVDELSRNKVGNFFLSHHPVLGFASSRNQKVLPGNAALQSVMHSLHPGRLFGPGVNLALHGHVHLFEAISFKSDHPAVFVSGNSGSDLSMSLPASLSKEDHPAPGAIVDEFHTQGGFGFLTLERRNEKWVFTEWNREGMGMLSCELTGDRLHCEPARETTTKP